MELAAVRRDGEEIPVELSVSAFRLDGRWHAVGRDERPQLPEVVRGPAPGAGAALADAGGDRRRCLTREGVRPRSCSRAAPRCCLGPSRRSVRIWIVDTRPCRGSARSVRRPREAWGSPTSRTRGVVDRGRRHRHRRIRGGEARRGRRGPSRRPGQGCRLVTAAGLPLGYGADLEGVLAVRFRRCDLRRPPSPPWKRPPARSALGIARLRLIAEPGRRAGSRPRRPTGPRASSWPT